jgi:hypothetical protein
MSAIIVTIVPDSPLPYNLRAAFVFSSSAVPATVAEASCPTFLLPEGSVINAVLFAHDWPFAAGTTVKNGDCSMAPALSLCRTQIAGDNRVRDTLYNESGMLHLRQVE